MTTRTCLLTAAAVFAPLAAPESGVAPPAHPNRLAVVDTARDLHLELLPRDRPAVAVAAPAGSLEHVAASTALRTGPLADELAEDVPRDPSEDSASSARAAGRRSRPGLRARSAAGLALRRDVDR